MRVRVYNLPMRMARARVGLTGLVLLGGCAEDFEMPPEVASSKYIDFHTDADASVICMDDRLAREDRFIERTAEVLGAPVPGGRIDYVFDPRWEGSDPWICPVGAQACYRSREKDDLSVVVARTLTQHHELVHAVEGQALGQGHPTLIEGLAEYLGTTNLSLNWEGFPERFKNMLDASPKPSEYRVAMHFVGSLIERYGVEKYRALRERMPEDAGLEEFAEVFAEEIGVSLDDALTAMDGASVYAVDEVEGCDEDAPVLAWTEPGVIDATIEAVCGDPWFYGGGFSIGDAGFYGHHVVEVAEAGMYELTVGGVGAGPVPLRAGVVGCSFDVQGTGVLSIDGHAGTGSLGVGRHTLGIAFPQRDEARGEATVLLTYLGPVPAEE